MELVNVPVLGAPETPDAVLVAVLCLWGDVDFFARFVMDPYVQVRAHVSRSSSNQLFSASQTPVCAELSRADSPQIPVSCLSST